jgi:hypothetical protein
MLSDAGDSADEDYLSLDTLFAPTDASLPAVKRSTSHLTFDDLPDDVLVLVLLHLSRIGPLFLCNSRLNRFVTQNAPYWFFKRHSPGMALIHLIGYGGNLCLPETIDALVGMGATFNRQTAQSLHARYISSSRDSSQGAVLMNRYPRWGKSSVVSWQAYAHILRLATERWGRFEGSSNDSTRLSELALNRRSALQEMIETAVDPSKPTDRELLTRTCVEFEEMMHILRGQPCDRPSLSR